MREEDGEKEQRIWILWLPWIYWKNRDCFCLWSCETLYSNFLKLTVHEGLIWESDWSFCRRWTLPTLPHVSFRSSFFCLIPIFPTASTSGARRPLRAIYREAMSRCLLESCNLLSPVTFPFLTAACRATFINSAISMTTVVGAKSSVHGEEGESRHGEPSQAQENKRACLRLAQIFHRWLIPDDKRSNGRSWSRPESVTNTPHFASMPLLICSIYYVELSKFSGEIPVFSGR